MLAVLFLLPVLYVLSCGPAIGLVTRGYMSREPFDHIYYPLSLAARSSDKIGRALEWYAELWAAPPPPMQTRSGS